MSFFHTYPVFVPIVAVLTAEVLKLLHTGLKNKKLRLRDFARPGGMPSGHSALAASIVMTAFLLGGMQSLSFAISAVFGLLVVYDAIKLRWEAGRHAKVLNYLLGQKKLEERLGHTFLEMLTGIFLGVGVAFLLLAQ